MYLSVGQPINEMQLKIPSQHLDGMITLFKLDTLHSSFTRFSFAHFLMTRLTMCSTCGLFVLLNKFTTSCNLSALSLPATHLWNTPTAAPRLPSQNSGSGSSLSRTSKALHA